MVAMRRAVEALVHWYPTQALIDGNRVPRAWDVPARAIIKGDRDIAHRYPLRRSWPRRRGTLCCWNCTTLYPQYGFAQNKGYGTPEHLAALERHGPCPGASSLLRARIADAIRVGPSGRKRNAGIRLIAAAVLEWASVGDGKDNR